MTTLRQRETIANDGGSITIAAAEPNTGMLMLQNGNGTNRVSVVPQKREVVTITCPTCNAPHETGHGECDYCHSFLE